MSPEAVDSLHRSEKNQREMLAEKHGQLIVDFLNSQQMTIDDIVVKEGHAPQIIKEEAEHHQAGLIVMGASRDKGRWERMTRDVTAEAAADDAPCDLLFIH